ncbi:MAG: glycoside hydrolase family 2 TIM barrel-domain containing protein [Planctomycetota bacterium]
MRNFRLCLLTAFLVASLLDSTTFAETRVVVESTGGKHRLLRNGKPYFIRGAGGDASLGKLVARGGNSIRTWGTEKLDTLLDEAQKNGLTVTVGFWLGHERHGFDYSDSKAVARQYEECIRAVRKYRSHPAVLMWGIGNEMEGSGKNTKIWKAIEDIAKECKRIDPNHPTMTVIAEIGGSKIESIETHCPSIDVIGVNSYGGSGSLGKRYAAAKGNKPFVITEFGPLGPWECGRTPWGSPIEESSTEKAKRYAEAYRSSIKAFPDLCLGSYAFLWGHKQESTATWFGMLLPDGSHLAPVDVLTAEWTGKAPKNRCPEISALNLDTKNLKPGGTLRATVTASDPDGDKLRYEWMLRADSGKRSTGGDFQRNEREFAKAVKSRGREVTVNLPEASRSYRLFIYVYDGHGGAAVANEAFRAASPKKLVAPKKAKLPFTLYGDGAKSSPFIPSGFMGNAKAVKLETERKNPRSGKTCLRAEYRASDAWGGVIWQSPAGDWEGDKPGGLDLSGATALEFWVRGAAGGEVVNFVFGVLDGQQKYRDTAKGELKSVKLTTKWRKLRIPLKGKDLSRIKTGFGWAAPGQGKNLTFFLDDIRYVR